MLVGCGGGYSSRELDAAKNFIRASGVDMKPEAVVEMAREALKRAGAKVSGENVRQVLEGAYRSNAQKAVEQIPDIARQVASYEKGGTPE